MHGVCVEGGGSTADVDNSGCDRVHLDTDRMNFRFVSAGYSIPVGWCDAIAITKPVESESPSGIKFTWSSIVIPRVVFSHPVHMALLEGASLQNMFLQARLEHVESGAVCAPTPLLLLRGQVSRMHKVPCEAVDVILGYPRKLLDTMILNDILLGMFKSLPSVRSAC
jgi:hypothetical protein